MINAKLDARIVKICSMGLKEMHLGKSITQLQPTFMSLQSKFGFNVCGEGGEYESSVFDCLLFKTHKIEIDEDGAKVVTLEANDYAPVSYLQLNKLKLVEKTTDEQEEHTELLQQLKE